MGMITGYTAPIVEKPDYTLNEYLWSCLRALIYDCQEQYPRLETGLRDVEKPLAELRELRDELQRLEQCPDAELQRAIEQEHANETKRREEMEAERQTEFGRLERMQQKFAEWKRRADPAVKPLAEFAESQLNQTASWNAKPWIAPPQVALDVARPHRQSMLQRQIADLEERIAQMRKFNQEWTDLIRALEASCPRPDVAP